MAKRIKPKKLTANSRIGIVNPSYWLDEDKMERAISLFENKGFQLVLGQTTHLKEHRFAGSPEERAKDIMAMFKDESIDAIICARGGYGGNRVLPLLDYDIIKSNPKILLGYSDITGYLCSISQQSNLITFHGPMLTTFANKVTSDEEGLRNNEISEFNFASLFNLLSGEYPLKLFSPKACQAKVLKAGVAKGELWGGNLCLLIERLATQGQLETDGIILFIEDVGEEIYAFERMFLHLKNSGSLEGIAGLIIGEMVEITDNHETPFGKSINEIVLELCEELDIPIISNYPCGHGVYQLTLPVSHWVELHADTDNPYILIPESPVN